MSDEKTRFTLRIDTDILDIVKESAKNNRRSAAMEIEYALDAYYKLKTIVGTSANLEHISKVEELFNADPDKFNQIFLRYQKTMNDKEIKSNDESLQSYLTKEKGE